MEELIKRLERVIATGAPDKDGMHPISAETVLEVVRGLSEHGTNLASLGTDCISRQAAIDALHMHLMYRMGTDSNKKRLDDWINGVPSVQPERTCVNCGRTINNGGWYADGGTRCPIEEHYALPKDGYCHLWEKRNITDDDYPERRTDG